MRRAASRVDRPRLAMCWDFCRPAANRPEFRHNAAKRDGPDTDILDTDLLDTDLRKLVRDLADADEEEGVGLAILIDGA